MIDIEKANLILLQNIKEINSVKIWSEYLEFKNSRVFSNEYRKYFKKRPFDYLINIRVKYIIDFIKNNPSEKMFTIALEFNLSDEGTLYKFLKRHTGKSPTYFLSDIQIGHKNYF